MANKFKAFILTLKDRYLEADLNNSAVIIAYYFLLSLFPLLIILGNILPYLQIDPSLIVDYLNPILPTDLQGIVDSLVHNLLTSKHTGLLSVSILVTLWSASKGINYLQTGMNKAYGVNDSITYITKQVVSVLTIILMFCLGIGFFLFFSVGQLLMDELKPTINWLGTLEGYITTLKWPVTIIFLFCMLMFIYKITPNVKLRLREVLPGAIFATLGSFILVQVFTIYLKFSTRFSGYGTLSTVFMLMFWLIFIVTVILIGAVLNATIHKMRYGEVKPQEHKLEDYLREKLLGKLTAWWQKRQLEKKPNK